MNIRKRGHYYECRVRLAGVSKSKTFDTKAEAKTWGEKIEYEIRQGMIKKTSSEDKIPFITVVNDFAKNCKHIYTNYKREESRVIYLLQFDGWPKYFAQVNKSHVKHYTQWRSNAGKKATTINKDLATISKLCVEFNNTYNASMTNPVLGQKVRLPEGSGRERRLQLNQLEMIRCNLHSERLRLIMDFALATTMRRSEIATLTWNQVSLNRRTLLLPHTKNKSARTVPLSSKALTTLTILSAVKHASEDLVFQVSADTITASFSKAVKKSNIKDFRFHDLRHEAISRLFENTDLNFFEVQSISGHKTTVALHRYVHLKSQQLVDRLG